MKLFRTVFALVALSSPAYAADVTDIKLALGEWEKTVESGKLDDIMALYDENAIMVSTFKQDPMTSRAQIEQYFKRVVVNTDIRVAITETHLRMFGDMAVDTGKYTLNYTEEGEPISIAARFSFTYVKRDAKWLIVDQHSSRVPLPAELK